MIEFIVIPSGEGKTELSKMNKNYLDADVTINWQNSDVQNMLTEEKWDELEALYRNGIEEEVRKEKYTKVLVSSVEAIPYNMRENKRIMLLNEGTKIRYNEGNRLKLEKEKMIYYFRDFKSRNRAIKRNIEKDIIIIVLITLLVGKWIGLALLYRMGLNIIKTIRRTTLNRIKLNK